MKKKVVAQVAVRTDDVAGFFIRAKDAARRADKGGRFDGKVTLSFGGPRQTGRLRQKLK